MGPLDAASGRPSAGEATATAAPRWSTSSTRTTERAPIRVFLLDDHDLVRDGIRTILDAEADLTVVGQRGTAAGAIAAMVRCRPDVAVVDLRLPDGSGIDVCRDVRDVLPEVRTVVFTGFDDDYARVEAGAAGAAALVPKRAHTDSLVEAIRHVAAGRTPLDRAQRRLARRRYLDSEEGKLARLTTQELRIFNFIGRGLTNAEIAEELGVCEKTVKNYGSHLFAKLGVSHRTEVAALWARLDERRELAG